MQNAQGISYFQNKTWNKEISRTEILFCAELYFLLKKQENLLKFIEKFKLEQANYDVGYEVSFYRDLSKMHGVKVKKEYFSKRTFDLALFSEKFIYVIEAKAQENFNTKQLGYFEKDKKEIPEMLRKINPKTNIKVNFLAITSGNYNPKPETKGIFEKTITWKQLHELYRKDIFKHADDIYSK
jgi:hypothetical protein